MPETNANGFIDAMNCETVTNSDLAQKYVLGELPEAEQAAYELHYFECESCFEDLRTLQATQSVLELQHQSRAIPKEARANPKHAWKWGAIAAGIFLACLTGWQVARFAYSRAQPPMVASGKPTAKPLPVSVTQGSADPHAAEWQLLARVDPPLYRAPVLRGAEPNRRESFRVAMQSYAKHDYKAAIEGLAGASNVDPAAPAPLFYLGVSYLMDDQASQAVVYFNRTIAQGNTPYLELAHFYLAKALMRDHDAASAQHELQTTILLRGDKQGEAQALLERLRAIRSTQ